MADERFFFMVEYLQGAFGVALSQEYVNQRDEFITALASGTLLAELKAVLQVRGIALETLQHNSNITKATDLQPIIVANAADYPHLDALLSPAHVFWGTVTLRNVTDDNDRLHRLRCMVRQVFHPFREPSIADFVAHDLDPSLRCSEQDALGNDDAVAHYIPGVFRWKAWMLQAENIAANQWILSPNIFHNGAGGGDR